MKEHQIKVNSIRDLDVTCTCGRWAMVYTATAEDTDEKLLALARALHRRHLESVQRREAKR